MGVSYPSDSYSVCFACCCSSSPCGRCLSRWPGEPDLLLAGVSQNGSVGQKCYSPAWGLLLFCFWKGAETHSIKVSKAAKLSKEKLRNTRNEVTYKLEVQPP